MTELVQKNFRIPLALNENIKKYSEQNVIFETDFIIQAIEEKLSRKRIEDKEFNIIVDQIKKMHPDVMHTDLKDAILNTRLIYEESKKQNEILKLILRRTSLSARFSSEISDKINGGEVTTLLQNEIVDLISSEIKQIQI